MRFCYNVNCVFVPVTNRNIRSVCMRISYKKLWVLLIQKDISKATLRKDVGLSTGTMSKLNKGEEVALTVLMRLCDYLDCDIGDICEVLRDE